MTRAFRLKNYGVYVHDERGAQHHRAHAHIKMRGQRVASVYLETLEVFNVVAGVPGDVLNEIEAKQEALLDLWEELNNVG